MPTHVLQNWGLETEKPDCTIRNDFVVDCHGSDTDVIDMVKTPVYVQIHEPYGDLIVVLLSGVAVTY